MSTSDGLKRKLLIVTVGNTPFLVKREMKRKLTNNMVEEMPENQQTEPQFTSHILILHWNNFEI
jgi:hypothetical protein